ncbi:MAG: putative sugar transporter, substrate-binding protein [Thermoleophilia bacterium]|nr:putative sugar transporter, substrate-binding protein [Thermoleophilia bacterium]
MRRTIYAAGVIAASLLVAAGCGSSDDGGSKSSDGGSKDSGSKSGKIALLLPESKTTRYETQDKPQFEAKLEEICADCEVLYSNADQDASKQLTQAQAALTNGAKVLVVDPVDAAAAAAIVKQADQQDVPVVSYDRLITDAKVAYYVSYDNAKVGELQGQSLVDKLDKDGKKGDIFMINGSPTDGNAALFKSGAHSVIDDSDYKVAKEYDTPDWSPDKAQEEAQQAITALGDDGFIGIYAANDGTAGGAIAALKAAKIDPTTIPITGQDAELAGIQRLVSGEQYMTIYKAIKPEAAIAAEVAYALLQGKSIDEFVTSDTDNGSDGKIPTKLFDPVAVTAENVNDTVVADGFWTVEQICTSDYAAACAKLGLK